MMKAKEWEEGDDERVQKKKLNIMETRERETTGGL